MMMLDELGEERKKEQRKELKRRAELEGWR